MEVSGQSISRPCRFIPRKEPHRVLNGGLGRPQSPERFEEDNNLLTPLPKKNPDLPAPSLLTIPNRLSRLLPLFLKQVK